MSAKCLIAQTRFQRPPPHRTFSRASLRIILFFPPFFSDSLTVFWTTCPPSCPSASFLPRRLPRLPVGIFQASQHLRWLGTSLLFPAVPSPLICGKAYLLADLFGNSFPVVAACRRLFQNASSELQVLLRLQTGPELL